MYLCYIDESGTFAVPGNSSHYVLAGIAIPIGKWREADAQISTILSKFGLTEAEFHTAWLLRKYLEQSRIANFEKLTWQDRRSAVVRSRNAHLLALQQANRSKTYRQAKKNYAHTDKYIHLTHAERMSVVSEVASAVARWGFARLFAECIDKIYFDPTKTGRTVDQQAFEQVVSRFEQYLQYRRRATGGEGPFGLIVHDSNPTVAERHTKLMRHFHDEGTLWTSIEKISETPLYVDSRLTRMVQIADLCSYALRRYVEYGESQLAKLVFARADRIGGKAVGVRHYTKMSCKCGICTNHG